MRTQRWRRHSRHSNPAASWESKSTGAGTINRRIPKAKSGYVRQDYTIALAKKAGFVFVAASEVNANPRDTKDWVDGVWTLPPTLSQGEKDRARYVAIGEADNYVLKFRKPQ
jgi:predicted methyltransferase